MTRRTLLWLGVLTLVAAGVALRWSVWNGGLLFDPDDADLRVRFVFCDNHGEYSPAVYSRCGGGHAAFDTVREAARFMRANDPGSSAAGLCGYLFKQFKYDGDTGGTLVLEPPPQPGPDGKINWAEYGGDSDVILINVDEGSATCCFGSLVGKEIHDLPLGGTKFQGR